MDRATYDRPIQTLHEAREDARLDKNEKLNAIMRLERYAARFFSQSASLMFSKYERID